VEIPINVPAARQTAPTSQDEELPNPAAFFALDDGSEDDHVINVVTWW
jgi:hypothetical protein